jgi:hypothetical protein
LCVLPFILFLSGILAYLYDKSFSAILFVISVIGIAPALLLALLGGGVNLGRVIWPLNPIEKAFLDLHTALGYREPLEGEKYDPTVQEDINRLIRSVANQLNQPSGVGRVLLEESDILLSDVIDDITDRIVPASKDGRLKPAMMRQIALWLSKPTIDGLRKLKTDIEADYESEEESVPWKVRFSEFFESQPGHIVQSVVFGLGMSLFGTFAISLLVGKSFQSILSDNAGFVLGGFFALTAGYIGYLAVQRRR